MKTALFKIMPPLEKLRKQSLPTALFFITIVIVPLQVCFLLSMITEGAISSLSTSKPQLIFPDNIVTAFVYCILPIIYCIIVSLWLFRPKRLVSPLFVQIGTMVVLSMYLIEHAFSSNSLVFSTPIGYSNLTQDLIFMALLAIAVGFTQEIIVKWVVALNFDSVDRKSFRVEMNPTDFLKLTWETLHDVWEFNRRRDNPKAKTSIIWVLKTHDRSGNSVILTIGSVQGNQSESIVATVAYHASAYGISTSKTASEMTDSIIRDVNGLLIQKAKPNLIPVDEVDDTISFKAYTHALSVTRPKTEIAADFFRNVHWYYKFAMIFTAITFVAISLAYITQHVDSNTYIGAVVVLVIAFVFEFGVALREEWSSREVEELE